MTNSILTFLTQNAWLLKAATIIFSSFILTWIESSIFHKVRPKLEKNARVWDDSFLVALHTPLLTFIWSITVTLLIPIVMAQLKSSTGFLPFIGTLQQVILIVALLWFVMRYIAEIESKIMHRAASGEIKQDRTSIRAVSQVVRISIMILAVLVIMSTLGIKIGTLLAVGGVGGLAISFAAKDTLANLIGGMMIFWDRPFSVGDWVRSPDRQVEGTVENIGWRLTRIRTFDKRPLYVPNGVFSNISIENPSRMTNRRIKTTIGLRYDDAPKVAAILKDVEQMLHQHDEIDNNQTLMVNLSEFGPSSLNFFIYTFTKTTDWVKFQKIQQDVFLKIIDIIAQHGAQCAFPTTTLHVPEGMLLKQQNVSSERGEVQKHDHGTEIQRIT